ncbi:AAA domain containing protein [uncultured Caudovirales phage]|uniref:AAA domain containing protein n=1 Tax=uncultured Caudovirales phage TaxID=2100421 RepID=A0A6J5SIM1_9CAUD|nr:AAA domain containing protein [uncultured Caudovirales phage]
MSNITTFTADRLITATTKREPILILFAPNGNGKTTFVSSIGNVFILDTEDKCNEVENSTRFVPKTYQEALECLKYLYRMESMPFDAVVIDTLDWLEKRVHEEICKTHNTKTIIDDKCKELNFGKGKILAANMFIGDVLPILEAIRKKHNIPVVLCAQQMLQKIKSPDVEEYQVVDLRLEPKLAAFISDKVDGKLYIQIRYNKDFKGAVTPTSERYLITGNTKGIAAKNSLHLPNEIDIGETTGWADFKVKIGTTKPKKLITTNPKKEQ